MHAIDAMDNFRQSNFIAFAAFAADVRLDFFDVDRPFPDAFRKDLLFLKRHNFDRRTRDRERQYSRFITPTK